MVPCPAALTNISGCVKNGDTPTGPASVATWTSGVGPTPTPTQPGNPTSTSTSAITTTTGNPGTSSCTSTEYSQCGGIGWTVRLFNLENSRKMLIIFHRVALAVLLEPLAMYSIHTTLSAFLKKKQLRGEER